MIKLTPSSVLIEKWDSSIREYVEVEFDKDDSLFFYMNEIIHVEDGTSFGEVLHHFISDPMSDIISGLLVQDAGGRGDILHKFDEVIDLDDENRNDILKIEYVELYHPGIKIDKDNQPINVWHFHGYGRWDEPYDGAYSEGHPREGGIAIEWTPICYLKDYSLRINTEVEIRDESWEVINTVNCQPTVFEFISGIINEMTFEGVLKPGDSTRIDEIMNRAENLGEENTIPWEDVKRELGIDNDDDGGCELEDLI